MKTFLKTALVASPPRTLVKQMTVCKCLLAGLLALVLPWKGQATIYLSGTYSQNFDTLASSGTSSVVPDGWSFSETGTGANTTYTAGTGSSATGDTYSFGSTGSGERALGGLLSGSLTPTFGVKIVNNTGATITSLLVSYIGEQWRWGGAGSSRGSAADRLDFQYSLDATGLGNGAWFNVDSLDFSSKITSGTTGALNGNSAANQNSISDSINGLSIASGSIIWLRWSDFNVTGSDDGLAVDNFSITATAVPEASTWYTGLGLSLGMLGSFIRKYHK